MKKVLLVFISILTFSLFSFINTNAQTRPVYYPNKTIKAMVTSFNRQQINVNTYEYLVVYRIFNQNITVTEDNYFFTTFHYIPIHKGINRDTNSYEIEYSVYYEDLPGWLPHTMIHLRVTLLKTFVDENYTTDTFYRFFYLDSALYISYEGTASGDYHDGYDDGYLVGHDDGYNSGYNIGKKDGYNEGVQTSQQEHYTRGWYDALDAVLVKFTNRIHIWLVPSIILVFIIGIFITYKKGRDE